MSASFNWMIVRNNSSFLMKKGPNYFSREGANLKGVHTFTHSGFIQNKNISVQPAKNGKGVVVTTKHYGNSKRPGNRIYRTSINKDGRQTIKRVANIHKAGRFNKKTRMAALRRVSAILRSQKPVVVKQKNRAKKN